MDYEDKLLVGLSQWHNPEPQFSFVNTKMNYTVALDNSISLVSEMGSKNLSPSDRKQSSRPEQT